MALDFTGERFVPKLRGQIYYEHMHRYAIALRLVAGKRVLDIASGEGYGSNLLAGVAEKVVGVDIDEESVDHARKRYYAPNLHFLRGSCEQIPLDAGSVDVVVSFETIEHADNHRRMLDEIRRVLVHDGSLLISSPNKLVYSDIPGNRNPFHVHELYYNELRDELTSRFPQVTIYGQRIAASSLVFPLHGQPRESSTWYSGNLNEVTPRLPELPDPVYFLALCGPAAGDHADLSSAFIDGDDDLLSDMQQEVLTLRHQAAAVNGAATHGAELALPTQRLSLPAGAENAESFSEAPREVAFAGTVRVLDSIATMTAVPDFLMPDAADERTIAQKLTLELLKIRARVAELIGAAAAGEAERPGDRVEPGERITLENALLAERQAVVALRDQIGALQTERLQLIQTHLLELRSAEREAAARSDAEIKRLESDVAAWRLRYADEARRIDAESAAKHALSAQEMEHIARERELLQSILHSNSWRLTRPLRLALAKARSNGGSQR